LRFALVLAGIAALLGIAFKTVRIETDFSAFLPPSATPEQRLLMSQLRDGLVSRLMLVALEGADEKTLARASRALAQRLAREPRFEHISNGSWEQLAAQGEVLLQHRYALSPTLSPQTFTVPALRTALQEQQEQMASPLGLLSRTTLTRDPTGEFLALLRQLDTGTAPATRQGIWFSADGRRALLLLQTRAAGFDSQEQAVAMAAVREALVSVDPKVQLTLSGPGVFAAQSQQVIEHDAWRLSLYSALFVLAMLVLVYRSPWPVLLVLTPVSLGLLGGVLVVQALFGSVHAITLGFAATLIGEAVDYPNYLLISTAPQEPPRAAAQRLRRTLVLAVLTTVASASALALSSFQGLAQLGVLTMCGVMMAGLATRRLLPWLAGNSLPTLRRPRIPFMAASYELRWSRRLAIVTALGAGLWLAFTPRGVWERDLSAISPVPPQARELDAQLRRDMGAPEVNILLVSEGDSEALALESAERTLPLLQDWRRRQLIRGYDSPASYLPSATTQEARRQMLPDALTLEGRLSQALRGLVFRPEAFAPFVREVNAARNASPLTRESYAGTALGAKLNAQVLQLDGSWLALTSLAGVESPPALERELAARTGQRTRLVDLKQVSSQMLDGYRHAALRQAAWGAALIGVLLVVGLASPRRAWRVLLPVAAALTLSVALLVLSGQRLSVFHLVALLLVLGIGLNYALFFERRFNDEDDRQRTLLALAVCSLSTMATFGLLALSSTPVLHAIGSTTALGALLSLLLSALWGGQSQAQPDASPAWAPSQH
jgi:predicted exporter